MGGDSAGGTLAASAALVRRDLGLPLAAQVLVYPPLDPDCSAASYHRAPEAFPARSALLEAWRDHRASSAGPADTSPRFPVGYSTPREAGDLSGVAAAALVVGSLDPVADDVRQYAQALSEAEVTAHLHELPKAGHGALLVSPGFRRRVADAYRAVLAAETVAGVRR